MRLRQGQSASVEGGTANTDASLKPCKKAIVVPCIIAQSRSAAGLRIAINGDAMAHPLVEALEKAVQRAREENIPLNDKLTIVADEVRSLSTLFAEAVDRMVFRLQANGAGETAPRVGQPMPPFVLPDEGGRLVSLDGLLRKGPLAISFNRGHWCPYCRLNAQALTEVQNAVADEGRQLIAVVPEKRRFTAALKAEAEAPFPILTDIDNGYALSLNLAIWVGAEMEELIAGAGWDVPAYQGNAAWMLPIPATFVVGTDGIITARYLDPDYRKRMERNDLLEALRAAS
jgi:peroxiredoxin